MTRKLMAKGMLSLILSAMMIIGLLPATTFAGEGENILTVTVEFQFYQETTENSGGTRHQGNPVFDESKTQVIEVDRSVTNEFDVPLDPDWGEGQVVTTKGINRSNFYNSEGGLHFTISDDFDSSTTKVRVNIVPNWTSRITQAYYTTDDGVNYTRSPNSEIVFAAAPTAGDFSEANNYSSTLSETKGALIEGRKGIKPNPPEGYHYSGKYYLGYSILNSDNTTVTTWHDASDFGLKYNEETGEITGSTPKLSGRELFYVYYYYTANKYKVTYISNEAGDGDGTSFDVNDVYEESEHSILSSEDVSFAKTGYVFKGWNTKADGSGTSYAAGDKLTMPAEDVVLYAKWEKVPADPSQDDTSPVAPSDKGDKADATGTGPKTGDEDMVFAWVVLALMASAGLGGLVIKRRR